MAKFELRFFCFSDDDSFITTKKSNHNTYCPNLIDISITDNNMDTHSVVLDKSTAIKFAKTLRTEINKITESEVNNG